MPEFLVFLLACYGTTNVLTSGRLFARPRKWLERAHPLLGHWAHCSMCTGAWVGGAWVALGLRLPVHAALATQLIAGAAVSSGWCWILRVVLKRLGEDEL